MITLAENVPDDDEDNKNAFLARELNESDQVTNNASGREYFLTFALVQIVTFDELTQDDFTAENVNDLMRDVFRKLSTQTKIIRELSSRMDKLESANQKLEAENSKLSIAVNLLSEEAIRQRTPKTKRKQ